MALTPIGQILSSGKTGVLLNGVPGRWINCRKGLRQGDPLSPYLFIIVADVLQRLVQRACNQGLLQHPIDAALPCPVLQYADDTLILTRGTLQSMTTLKQLLDDFSLATGLTINFHKSTFVPMNVPPALAASMAASLGCTTSSFPQTYLGLPLSPNKLKVSDYQPLISTVDRYLSGWKARLLSVGGRLILVNAVLSSLPIYFMSSNLTPKTVREILDARRRAFLWTGEDKCHGSQCLIAWEKVCKSKENGGLGVKKLEDLNHCLLMKFVHKIHDPSELPWKNWYFRQAGHELGSAPAESFLARLIHEELPRYRALTVVAVGDGRTTAFWLDQWLFDDTLAEVFPALFSHCLRPNISVKGALRGPMITLLRPRLSQAAISDMCLLDDCLQAVTLTDRPDRRALAVPSREDFSTRGAYRALHATDQADPGAARVWKTKLPSKVKFFAWLLINDRLNTRANLFHKNIRTLEESFCESCAGVLETDTHIFAVCANSSEVWMRLGIPPDTVCTRIPWMIGASLPLPEDVRLDVILTILWHIWKARNNLIFEKQNSTATIIIQKAAKDLEAWSCRYRNQKHLILAWINFLLPLSVNLM